MIITDWQKKIATEKIVTELIQPKIVLALVRTGNEGTY